VQTSGMVGNLGSPAQGLSENAETIRKGASRSTAEWRSDDMGKPDPWLIRLRVLRYASEGSIERRH